MSGTYECFKVIISKQHRLVTSLNSVSTTIIRISNRILICIYHVIYDLLK